MSQYLVLSIASIINSLTLILVLYSFNKLRKEHNELKHIVIKLSMMKIMGELEKYKDMVMPRKNEKVTKKVVN